MKKSFLYGALLPGLFVFAFSAPHNSFAATTGDSVAYAQGGYVVTKRTDAAGWVYICADTVAQTYFEVRQTGGMIRKFVVFLHGVHYSLINETNGIPKMMPWPNRTAGGKFTDANGAVRDLLTTPLMTQNDGAGNAIHGMVSGRPWQVSNVGSDSEGVFVRCYFDTQGWPVISSLFGEFRDYTVYHLRGNTLIIDAYTQNNSAAVFPNCGWGFHPWINAPILPLEGSQNGSRARCSLLMPADSIALVTTSKIPTGVIQHVASYQSGYFDFNSLKKLSTVNVDNFFTGLKPLADIPYTRSLLIDFGNKVRLQFLGQYPFYPWMVIYTPSNMVCIEHQTEEVNGLNTKLRLISIPAHAASAKGRVIVIADDDTTITYKPVVAAHRDHYPHKSTFSGGDAVFFSLDKITLRLERFEHPVSIEVYSLEGKRVARFERRYGNAGRISICWNKTDMTGRRVANGIYQAVVFAGSFRTSGKLVVQ
jgi:galactose mutarotase-like enzyme